MIPWLEPEGMPFGKPVSTFPDHALHCSRWRGDSLLLQGFYKVWFRLNDAPGRSVMYVHAGQMLGGNSSFAHIGTFHESDGDYIAEVRTERHHTVPNYRPLAGSDAATLVLRGKADGDLVRFD